MIQTMADAPHHRLVASIASALRRRCGVREGDHLLAAVSGGPDSIAMLRALRLLAPRRTWRLQLHVGHVQHHLRGTAAEMDAQFVAELADRLHLPLHRLDLDLRHNSGNLEARARHERYLALAQMARQAGAKFVATAHHGDDQLETMLMRILRGTQIEGLRGIAWQCPLSQLTRNRSAIVPNNRDRNLPTACNPIVIRPMLGSDHATACHFLNTLGQPWRDDLSNKDRSRTRARLRLEVLPVLRDLRPSAARKAVELADHLRQIVQKLDKSQK